MSDVIDFTKIKQKREQEKLDNIAAEFESDEEEVANIAALATMEIVDVMIHSQYPIRENPECIKDILGMIESIRALGYRAKGLNTPIHEVNNTLYGFIDDEASLLDDFLADMEDNLS